jgi:hypothetical protein
MAKRINHSDTEQEIMIQVDINGDEMWQEYKKVRLKKGEYHHHIFPDGYSAHWVRLEARNAGQISATFFYN